MSIINTKNNEWHKYFIEMALLVATKSKDSSIKCGCVITTMDNVVLVTGYNGLPRGIEYEKYKTERPNKYFYTEHAERNAIFHAAREGISLKNSKAYITGPPCADCARGFIQVGTKEIYIPSNHLFKKSRYDRWKESFDNAQLMFKEANINYAELCY